MAPLRYAAKFDPFLSLDYPPALYPGTIQGKEGIKFCHLATLHQGHPHGAEVDGQLSLNVPHAAKRHQIRIG